MYFFCKLLGLNDLQQPGCRKWLLDNDLQQNAI